MFTSNGPVPIATLPPCARLPPPPEDEELPVPGEGLERDPRLSDGRCCQQHPPSPTSGVPGNTPNTAAAHSANAIAVSHAYDDGVPGSCDFFDCRVPRLSSCIGFTYSDESVDEALAATGVWVSTQSTGIAPR